MKLLMVIAPEKFRDEEFEVPRAAFSEAGIDVVVASTREGACHGFFGTEVLAELAIKDASVDDYDGIIIVGGIGAQDHLWFDKELRVLAKSFSDAGKVTAAICLSPAILAAAGILKDRQATVFRSPGSLKLMEEGGAHLTEIPVVADGHIVTARGPEAAGQFAEMIIGLLGC